MTQPKQFPPRRTYRIGEGVYEYVEYISVPEVEALIREARGKAFEEAAEICEELEVRAFLSQVPQPGAMSARLLIEKKAAEIREGK
jgi:hypothetical protein